LEEQLKPRLRQHNHIVSPLLVMGLTVAPVVAYSKNDLTVSLQPTRTGPGKVSIQAIFRNDSIGSTFEKVNMQAAVPKSQKLRLEPINSPTIQVGEEGVQNLRITASQGVSVINTKTNFRLRSGCV
jgi:Adaptin C-terminal domain